MLSTLLRKMKQGQPVPWVFYHPDLKYQTPSIMAFMALLLIIISCANSTKINVTIFAITNLNSTGGHAVVNAQRFAIQEINAKGVLFNYYLNLEGTANRHPFRVRLVQLVYNNLQTILYTVHNIEGHSQKALLAALDICKYKSNKTSQHIYFPIILGASWSSLSTVMNPILGAYDMGQISAGATSILLSDTNRYPFFYRYLNNCSPQF